ncbi:hypothetical protein BGZ61DRAFT_539477 [Ilyonectria robusta]|uniref:uncharacterized protein n=1 Tax=Ilyonectria robusta TaxID=1079257 RepID=UPI001E8E2644|nr:uncharacterized protein BGZ61DRAFT_539477 [Ilyonectria robusta]KAH8662761.1 hypothetical protein BGZ61DRAFT_539477 [Ilyonectria robusta]
MTTPQSLTFLGLGNMGSALVQALLKASNKVTIWNRTAARPQVRAAVEAGAILEADVQSAISRNNTIVICLLDYSRINTALADIPTPALEGKTIVNLTNPETRTGDGRLGRLPLCQTPLRRSGHAFKPIASFLEPLGRPEYLGTAIDAAALSSMYGMFSGMFVAMALLKKGHTTADEKLEPVVSGSLNPCLGALIPYIGLIARSGDDKAWDDNLGNPIGLQAQALRNILEACRDDGMDDGFLKNLTTAMEGVVKDRGENGGIAVIGEYLLNGRLTKE